MVASRMVADALALGVLSAGLGLVAFCLGLDPRPVWSGDDRRMASDGLFFLPFYALLAAALGGVVRLGIGLTVPLLVVFPPVSGALGYALRFLYASRRSGPEKLVWVLALTGALAYLPWLDLSGPALRGGWL